MSVNRARIGTRSVAAVLIAGMLSGSSSFALARLLESSKACPATCICSQKGVCTCKHTQTQPDKHRASAPTAPGQLDLRSMEERCPDTRGVLRPPSSWFYRVSIRDLRASAPPRGPVTQLQSKFSWELSGSEPISPRAPPSF